MGRRRGGAWLGEVLEEDRIPGSIFESDLKMLMRMMNWRAELLGV